MKKTAKRKPAKQLPTTARLKRLETYMQHLKVMEDVAIGTWPPRVKEMLKYLEKDIRSHIATYIDEALSVRLLKLEQLVSRANNRLDLAEREMRVLETRRLKTIDEVREILKPAMRLLEGVKPVEKKQSALAFYLKAIKRGLN